VAIAFGFLATSGCREPGAGAGPATGARRVADARAAEEADGLGAIRGGTVVIAATGEPASVLPPLAVETVARDIGDFVYERLADLEPGRPTIDTTAFRPRLASSWERVDSLTWRFHLRPAARWSDGHPVTAEDVRFSFDVFSDSALDAPARAILSGHVRAVAEDSATVRLEFSEAYPEQLYDATYHVRILPRHVWAALPREEWARDTALARLVGSGPYRVVEWRRGQYLRLVTRGGLGATARELVWRFAPDPDAALNLMLAHRADAMELVGAPAMADRATRDPALRLLRYPSAAYGFLGFNLARGARAARVLGDRATRRALAMAVDRAALARATFGPGSAAPPGPMSRLLWIWSDSIAVLPFDTAAAERALDRAGWRPGPGGVRRRGNAPLAFDILVPATSSTRRQLATGLQEAWRRVGVRVTITTVDFPVFQERLGRGRFDAYIGAWLDEPSPRGLADQWTRAGWSALNYGHYGSAAFDSLFAMARGEREVPVAGRLYREAMDTLNADAPAIFLYTPASAAVVSPRLERLRIDPYNWLSGLRDEALLAGR
jgi:peptide/nickel transport system substrate-binding protein